MSTGIQRGRRLKKPISLFGEALREGRLKKEISLRKLSEMLSVSPTYLSMIETGSYQPPSRERLRQICRILNLSVEELERLAGYQPSIIQDCFEKHGQLFIDICKEIKKINTSSKLIDFYKELLK